MFKCGIVLVVHQGLSGVAICNRLSGQTERYDIGILVFKCLHGLAPAYLADYCQPTTVTAGRTRLRSSHTRQLAVSRTNMSYGDRSFAVSGPSMWNSLPAAVRSVSYTHLTLPTIYSV